MNLVKADIDILQTNNTIIYIYIYNYLWIAGNVSSTFTKILYALGMYVLSLQVTIIVLHFIMSVKS